MVMLLAAFFLLHVLGVGTESERGRGAVWMVRAPAPFLKHAPHSVQSLGGEAQHAQSAGEAEWRWPACKLVQGLPLDVAAAAALVALAARELCPLCCILIYSPHLQTAPF